MKQYWALCISHLDLRRVRLKDQSRPLHFFVRGTLGCSRLWSVYRVSGHVTVQIVPRLQVKADH